MASFSFSAAGVGRQESSASGVASFTMTAVGVASSIASGSGASSFTLTAAGDGSSVAAGLGQTAFAFGIVQNPNPPGSTGIPLLDLILGLLWFLLFGGGSADSTGSGSTSGALAVQFTAVGGGSSESDGGGMATFVVSALGSGESDAVSFGLSAFLFVPLGSGESDVLSFGIAPLFGPGKKKLLVDRYAYLVACVVADEGWR